jgi:hypothetical protein
MIWHTDFASRQGPAAGEHFSLSLRLDLILTLQCRCPRWLRVFARPRLREVQAVISARLDTSSAFFTCRMTTRWVGRFRLFPFRLSGSWRGRRNWLARWPCPFAIQERRERSYLGRLAAVGNIVCVCSTRSSSPICSTPSGIVRPRCFHYRSRC